jgi:hypothetical protein
MRWFGQIVVGVGLVLAVVTPGWAQLTPADIEALRQQGEREGWTFTVAESEATRYPLEQLCGLVVPDRWWERATFDPCPPRRDLPSAFDWRNYNGQNYCTPIRNQGGCGSCWAFATVGALECNIKIMDNASVDLSEQWLVSCNSDGWGCPGGFFAHDYHQWKTDSCGGTGAVLESAFPYTATDAPCGCPYQHSYLLTSWAYIGNDSSVPPTNSIKQAIVDHGPVSVAVSVNSAFQAYSGGIFNGCASGTINHAVVLVGWSDAEGCWIMRNSWGTSWGESGYMRIPYNCSYVGYAACYVVYPGSTTLTVDPAGGFSTSGPAGGPFTPGSVDYTLHNHASAPISYQVNTNQPWLSPASATGTVPGGGTVTVTVSIASDAAALSVGTYGGTIRFVNLADHDGDTSRAVTLKVGVPRKLYGWNLDANPGWPAQGQWAFGSPTGGGGHWYGKPDPQSGYTGTNVYGVNLSGDYSTTPGGPYYLTVGPLNLANAIQADLKFRRWLNTDQEPYAYATVQVSNNGSTWTMIWHNGQAAVQENTWSLQEYDLSSLADRQPTVWIRWGYQITQGVWPFAGWNIDDVEVWGVPTNSPSYLPGDMDCDGAVTFGDIDLFVEALGGESAWTHAACPWRNGDLTGDGQVTFADIDPFVAAIGTTGP